ncbi:uncharacterized protein LOC62_02G003364 [Vanrija pseudolonga]|uniref:Uncharacterized protein n=1 Tax=Vanrija pseudolonga TaxID=143232 RepID=A0AAF0Y818_9TREE|nr:hypothetical protein LOC62_02G003364 [Vanrija pseudolonga]
MSAVPNTSGTTQHAVIFGYHHSLLPTGTEHNAHPGIQTAMHELEYTERRMVALLSNFGPSDFPTSSSRAELYRRLLVEYKKGDVKKGIEKGFASARYNGSDLNYDEFNDLFFVSLGALVWRHINMHFGNYSVNGA